MWKRVGIACVVLAVMVLGLSAQEPKPEVKPPAVSEVQRLTFQNAVLRMKLAEQQARVAQAEYDKARQDAEAIVTALQVPGFTLDQQTLTYAKAPEPKK